MILEIDNLSKNFGKLKAVNKINLNIAKGTVFGLLGPNGSGKTTTLGMLLGVTTPTSGSFSWFGQGDSPQIRKNIGAILEQPVFYPYMTGAQNLDIVCKIKELPKERVEQVLEQVNLLDRKNDLFTAYSLGMKQRLAIASALLCNPKVLVLDEPTNGLDPQGIAEIRDIITDIADSGKSIILASHLLDEVQKVCSHFCVLQKGNLIYQGKVEDDFSNDSYIEVASDNNLQLMSALNTLPEIKEVTEQENILIVKGDSKINSLQLNKHLMAQGIAVSHLATITKSLEERFLEILADQND